MVTHGNTLFGCWENVVEGEIKSLNPKCLIIFNWSKEKKTNPLFACYHLSQKFAHQPTINYHFIFPHFLNNQTRQKENKTIKNTQRRTLQLTLVSSGLMDTARVLTRTSVGLRSGTGASGRSSSTCGPPKRGKTTALQVVTMNLHRNDAVPGIWKVRSFENLMVAAER